MNKCWKPENEMTLAVLKQAYGSWEEAEFEELSQSHWYCLDLGRAGKTRGRRDTSIRIAQVGCAG